MKLTRPILMATLSSLLITVAFQAKSKDLDYQNTQQLSLAAADLDILKIDAHAGFLIIEGEAASNQIKVTADIKAYDKNYQLTLEEKNGKAILIADPNPDNVSSWFGGDSPKIDLTIQLPKNMSLYIDDGSGNIEIKNIDGAVSIDDGSGNIDIKNLASSLKIDDGSGNIELKNIAGMIKIDDGSGSIDIKKAQADVDIDDGSGSIRLKDIAGKVDLDDGSGDISIEKVKGHVTIDDGSGDINVRDLEDGLTIVNAGSGGLEMNNVKGNIVTK